MNAKLRSTTVHLPAEILAEIDALADRLPPLPGARFSRNGWIAQTVVDALDATRSRNAATQTTSEARTWDGTCSTSGVPQPARKTAVATIQ